MAIKLNQTAVDGSAIGDERQASSHHVVGNEVRMGTIRYDSAKKPDPSAKMNAASFEVKSNAAYVLRTISLA